MKNKSFLGGRLPVASHKGQGRPAALTGVQFAGPVDVEQDDKAPVELSITTPEGNTAPVSEHQTPSIPKRRRSPPKAETAASSGGKRYYFTLQIERSVINRLETIFEQNPNAKRGAVMRKVATAFREALVAEGPVPAVPYTVKDPVTVPLDLRLPEEFVRAVKERDDPLDLEPTTTVLGRYIAPRYAKQLQAIGKPAR